MVRSVAFVTMLGVALMGNAASAHTSAEMTAITASLGPGTLTSANVYRVGIPRSNGAVGGYAAFETLPNGKSLLLADLRLLPGERDTAVTALRAEGMTVTPLGDRLDGMRSRAVFVEVLGEGDAVMLAQGLRRALTMTGTAISAQGRPSSDSVPFAREVERIMGRKGTMADGVLAIAVPRGSGVDVINVAAAGDGRVAGYGDLPLREAEAEPMVALLRSHGFTATSTRRAALDVVHFWRVGSAAEVASGLHDVLSRPSAAR
jgi:hypothetical protein